MYHVLKWNVVKRVNGGDIFFPCFWRFHQHSWVIPTYQSPSSVLCVLLTLIPPAWGIAAPSALLPWHQCECRSVEVRVALLSTAPRGAFWGGTPGDLPSVEIWQRCLRAVGPSGEIRLFLEVFVAQATVIKASMFSKGNEYFAGYVRKNSGT